MMASKDRRPRRTGVGLEPVPLGGPMSTRVNYLLGLLAPSLIALGAHAALPAHAATAQSFTLSAQGDGIDALHVQSSGGQVRVRGSRETKFAIKGSRTMGDSTCTLAKTREGSTLKIVVADSAGAPCRVDIDIAAPLGTATTIVSDEGNVFVSGLRAALDLTLSRGNAVVGGSFAHFAAHLTRGSLSAQGVGQDATVAIENGNAQLWLDKPRSKATVALDVAQGNVTLTLPQGPVVLDVHVDQGEIHNALPESPTGAIAIKGQMGRGNLTLRAASGARPG